MRIIVAEYVDLFELYVRHVERGEPCNERHARMWCRLVRPFIWVTRRQANHRSLATAQLQLRTTHASSPVG